MSYQYLRYRVQNRIANITLDRPDKRNALNPVLIRELKSAFLQAEQDPACKVIILGAAGKVFSAGADLSYLQDLQSNTYQENLADSNSLKELFVQIHSCPKISIAKVQGHAIAGGCGLVTVCDFAFAAEDALMGYTEVKIGFIPALVAGFALKKLGETRAKELLLTGKLITAGQGAAYGLINQAVPAPELDKAVQTFAEELAAGTSGESVAMTKELIHTIQGQSTMQALETAAEINAKARNTPDFKKGLQAFLNKETLTW